MADPIDLTTLQDVKDELGPTTPSSVDALLARIITAASRMLMTATGRRFIAADVVRRFNGDSTYGLQLPNGPVNSVAFVFVDGVNIPQATGPGQPGWTLLYDRLELVGFTFTTGTANVQVNYNSGFSPVPQDIARAAVELSCWLYQNRNHIGIQQRSVHDAEAITFRPDTWPFYVQMTVGAYSNFMGMSVFSGTDE